MKKVKKIFDFRKILFLYWERKANLIFFHSQGQEKTSSCLFPFFAAAM